MYRYVFVWLRTPADYFRKSFRSSLHVVSKYGCKQVWASISYSKTTQPCSILKGHSCRSYTGPYLQKSISICILLFLLIGISKCRLATCISKFRHNKSKFRRNNSQFRQYLEISTYYLENLTCYVEISTS